MPQEHKASGLLEALERHVLHRGGEVLREVTIDDPHVVRHRAAYYAAQYPGSYGDTTMTRKLGQDDLTGVDWQTFVDGGGMLEPSYRRIDAVVFDRRNKDGVRPRTAVEVKVTRADFLRETEEKRRAWRDHTHRFVYLVPAGLLSPSEIPDGCGLWECEWYDHAEYGRTYHLPGVSKRAVWNAEAQELYTGEFSHYLAGRAARAERELRELRRARTKDLSGIQALQAQLSKAQSSVWDEVPRT